MRRGLWLSGALCVLACELQTREPSPASVPARVVTAPAVGSPIEPAVFAAAVRAGVRQPDPNQGLYEVDAFLVALNGRARREGLDASMRQGVARSLVPTLRAAVVTDARVREATRDLAEALRALSPRVVGLDAGSLLELFAKGMVGLVLDDGGALVGVVTKMDLVDVLTARVDKAL